MSRGQKRFILDLARGAELALGSGGTLLLIKGRHVRGIRWSTYCRFISLFLVREGRLYRRWMAGGLGPGGGRPVSALRIRDVQVHGEPGAYTVDWIRDFPCGDFAPHQLDLASLDGLQEAIAAFEREQDAHDRRLHRCPVCFPGKEGA